MLGGGQSKQAVIKSGIFAIIAVFIPQRTALQAFFSFFTPKANFPARQPLSSATVKQQQRVTVCIRLRLCVLPRPWASLTPIKKRGRETNSG